MRTSADEWFGRFDLGIAPTAATTAVIGELVEMLDSVRPSLLDRDRSSVQPSGHGWTLEHSVVAHLAHATNPEAGIDVVIGEKEATVSWISAHEHVHSKDGDEQRPWTTVVVDAVAAVLRGEYVIEEHWRGEHLKKVHIIDVAGNDERMMSTTGSLFAWLPSRRPWKVERRVVSYGVAPWRTVPAIRERSARGEPRLLHTWTMEGIRRLNRKCDPERWGRSRRSCSRRSRWFRDQ